MRCAAPVTDGRMIGYRSSRDRSTRCQRHGHRLIAGKWFCYQHAPTWERHYAIVERIRNLPGKAIY